MKQTTPRHQLNHHRCSRDTAFTLTELLVVISLIVLLLAIAVPAFSSMLYNNNRSLADTQLRVALATARDQAIRSEGGDTAAVFLFQPNGRLRILTCVQVAEFEDDEDGSEVEREVFVPVATVNPVDLPRGWVVRGYLPPQDQQRDADRWYGTHGGSLEKRYSLMDGCWIFPEDEFYSLVPGVGIEIGPTRSSFMVRFEAGTGALVNTNIEEVLVVDIAPLPQALRNSGSFALTQIEKAANLTTTVKRILDEGSNFTVDQRRDALGDRSPDTVLVRPVSQLAVLDERRMVQQIDQGSGQLNRATGCLYGNPTNPGLVPGAPTIDTSLFVTGTTSETVSQWVSQWINGTYPGRNGPVGEAHIFTVDRASGHIREVAQ